MIGLAHGGFAAPVIEVPPDPDPAKLAKLLLLEKPTAESYDAVAEILNAIPVDRQGYFLAALFGLSAHPWIFQIALLLVWKVGAGARGVADAAGSRDTLKAWFLHARLDWPVSDFVAEAVTVWTPRELTVYRGGRGDPAKLAAEFSWSPVRPIAAKYAIANPHPHHEADGPPVIVRRHVRRAEIAVKWLNADQETVLLDEGPWEIDTMDVDVLAALAEEARALDMKIEAQRAAFVQRHLQRRQGNLAL